MERTTALRDEVFLDEASFDHGVVLIVGLLMSIGVVMVYSALTTLTGPGADAEPMTATLWEVIWHTPLRQGLFALAGFVAMVCAASINPYWLRWSSPAGGRRLFALYGVALALLVLMHIPGIGRTAMGATRSLVIVPGLLSFQPAEIAKLVIVIWFAGFLSTPFFNVRTGRGFLVAGGSGLLLIGLVAIEDFGTGALMGVLMMVLLLVGGARLWHLGAVSLTGLVAGVGFVLMRDYRLERLESFFFGDADPLGAGYQIRQAMYAIGSGGWWGRGLGAGVQKYDYLPQDNNDFILAVICEELGIVGGLVVVGLFVLFLLRGWWITRTTASDFGRRLALGLTLMVCLQAAFNIGVVTQSVPTKGISLPFVSAGGSGVVFLGVAAGLLAGIGGRRGRVPAQLGD
jgi:cell division protein FtsW